MSSNTYSESNARKVIPLVSDDGGLTWYPKGGDSADVYTEANAIKIIRLLSNDAGDTWVPNEA